ncbi:MAG: caspase family protein [Thermodesulfobacteriota bacterium]|nr:caspase family protein [Thermodesulfobacteriota bacterium]
MKNTMIVVLILLLFAVPLYASDTCDLAKDVATKAAATFSKDKAAGLKLFIKAKQLCGSDPSFAYNLGVAYYQYGSLNQAQQQLEAAVANNGHNARWLNNLASVLIETGDAAKALDYAERAVKQDAAKPNYYDTLIRAQIGVTRLTSALKTAGNATAKWPKDKALQQSYATALDAYLSYYLRLIQSGQVDKGLAGLKKVDNSVEASVMYCQALGKLNRSEQALQAATAARKRFAKNAEVKALFSDILQQTVRNFYVDFQAGRSATAVQGAKVLHEKYPNEAVAKKAYDELFNAFLADAGSIEVPKQVAPVRNLTRATGRADALLAGLGNSAPVAVDTNLKIDIEESIPKGKLQRKYGVAVVIGNQSYKRNGYGIGDVRYAGRDAAVMKKYLQTTMGFDPKNILYYNDTSSGDLRNIFGTRENPKGKLHNFVRAGESEVFIYYVGHGAPGPDGKSAYLVPVDANADYIANNGYPLDLFYNVVAKLPAKSVTVVLDACFSGDSPAGSLFDNISPAMVKNINPVRELQNTVVFSSADKDQVSTWYPAKRHSMFTYWFLKGLGGDADTDSNKSITAGEMDNYLKKEVTYWAQREANREQKPLMTGSGAAVLVTLR